MANVMLGEHEERLIAQGLREGKVVAWQALYDAYAEGVWGCVARLLGPRGADVADVVQETLLAAARSAATFDAARGSLWLWLCGIARNQAALYFRKQQRGQHLLQADAWLATSNDQLLAWLEDKQPAPPQALLTAELASRVRATLALLPADYALLLTARYLDGVTVAALANSERSSEVAVRSKLARAGKPFARPLANTS